MSQRQVIIMRGVSGSGKSTLAQNLASKVGEGESVIVVSADHWFSRNGTYQFDPGQLHLAHGDSQKKFFDALKTGTNLVIVDNTNIKLRDMKVYIDGAKKFNYDWKIVQVETPSPKNVHGVPPERVQQMTDRLGLETDKMPAEWKSHLEVVSRPS